MKLKKLICSVLALILLLAVAGCGSSEKEGSDTGKKKSKTADGVNIELLLTADISGAVTEEQAATVKAVLEERIKYLGGTDGLVEFDSQTGEFHVGFTAKGDKEAFETEEAAYRLCERGVLTFCRNEDQSDVILTGFDDVKTATAAYDDAIDDFVVRLELTDEGGVKFAQATAEMIGQKISIRMDDVEISAPTVQSAITGNIAVITGLGSFKDAEELAGTINGGALPFRLVIDENSIKIGR